MADLRVSTISGVDTVLKEVIVAAFKQSLRGALIVPGDDSYAEARQVWNANIDRRPGLIARPAGVADIIQAVNFARDHHLLVSVRGGAHSFAGTCVCNGGLVMVLSQMKGRRVDRVRRVVRPEGGVKWGEFDHETQAFGLATTGGTASDTGIAGLTLGGGLGWLGYKYGLAADNLLSVDIVTADGQVRIASDTENPDLFWGVRGGGGNFGVVASFEYRLHPVGPVLAGLVVHPFAKAREALQFYRDFSSATHEELTTYAGLLTSPEGAKTVAIGRPARERAESPRQEVGEYAYLALLKAFLQALLPPLLYPFFDSHPFNTGDVRHVCFCLHLGECHLKLLFECLG